tara:strand:- start:2072 stop:2359 length:288 start_codon:yes stop_codon:yes gene_type:complete
MNNIFSQLPNDIIIKILHENKINHIKDKQDLLFKDTYDDLMDEFDDVLHSMKNQYENHIGIAPTKLWWFIENDYSSLWCLTHIHNKKLLVDDDDY